MLKLHDIKSIQNLIALNYSANDMAKKELVGSVPFTTPIKTKMTWNEFNEGCEIFL